MTRAWYMYKNIWKKVLKSIGLYHFIFAWHYQVNALHRSDDDDADNDDDNNDQIFFKYETVANARSLHYQMCHLCITCVIHM